MNKDELNYAVKQLPIFKLRDSACRADEGYWEEDKDSKAITKITENKPVAWVSNKYALVQHHELYTPILEQFQDYTGGVIDYGPYAIMDIYPVEPEYSIENNSIGLVAHNSVNKKSSLHIKFCIFYDGKTITMPASVASFKKAHKGDVTQKAQNYVEVLVKIKDAWRTITEKFTKIEVLETDIENYKEQFGLSDKMEAMIRGKLLSTKMNLWQLCMYIIDTFTESNSKSEVHRRRRIDAFVAKIFEYSVAFSV